MRRRDGHAAETHAASCRPRRSRLEGLRCRDLVLGGAHARLRVVAEAGRVLENIDLLRDALLTLIHAFWFEEVDSYGDVVFLQRHLRSAQFRGAERGERRRVGRAGDARDGGRTGGAAVGRAPGDSSARRVQGEVAAALGWMQKRTSENRHLLQFSALARRDGGFIEESVRGARHPRGSVSERGGMLLARDRDDLVHGVKWHGGFVRVARRMGRVNYSASGNSPGCRRRGARRWFKEFASEQRAKTMDEANDRKTTTKTKTKTTTRGDDKIARLLDMPVMPTESELLVAGRHSGVGPSHTHRERLMLRRRSRRPERRQLPATGKPLRCDWTTPCAAIHARASQTGERAAVPETGPPRETDRGSSQRIPRRITPSATRGSPGRIFSARRNPPRG